ncbi:SulP family inorganic anion transporter [Komagataeibacter swingsii]|uniref:Sodium-independent anion transporter n=1 Tax=Komagataeibacter swingsii TaxID=215220 RepID=A0A2V4RPJ3_9PROT|nr:SulP family inorganic anion transporter [Komagataeibacter swingsii]PYD69542.1 sodium-independent anion transporter [Komagataeibacter swingsii]GBQ59777.1 sulfate permease [Komagataeibacter swingsii DSM 16373]
MSALARYRQEWFGNITRDTLAGMVGTFALIPEVIAFSFVAGVDPAVGLYASFVISVVIAFTGGRPGMISGAAGSVALVAAALVRAHGVQYLLAATLLCGLLQVVFGILRLHVLMRYVSRPVRTGFVNALAILIFSAQVPHMLHVTWHTYAMIALGLVIIYTLPRLFSAIPSPLICIVVLTVVSVLCPMPLHTVADLGRLPDSLPHLVWPDVPFSVDTLSIIAPFALAMASVGVLESMMTARVVDDLTETHSSKRQECMGLGIANIAVGLFGGIAGCGMIGQTVGNLRYGGRGRLSTFVAGAFLLLLMVMLRPWVAQVPVAALVAIMIMVSASTFSWSSLRDLVHHPRTTSVIMLATVAVVVGTHDLAAGVAVGVMLNGLFFAFQVSSMLSVSNALSADGQTRTYIVNGQVFFASSDGFADAFDLHDTARHITIDLTHAHIWDMTAAGMLEELIGKMEAQGMDVQLIGLNGASTRFLARHTRLQAG